MNSLRLTDTCLECADGTCRVFYRGVMIAQTDYENDALIRWIWVKPQYRRQGLAKMMLAEIERKTSHVAHPLPPVSQLAQSLFK